MYNLLDIKLNKLMENTTVDNIEYITPAIKIDVFQISLDKIRNKKEHFTFREVFESILPYDSSNKPLQKRFLQYFVKNLDVNQHYTIKGSKKAITLRSKDNSPVPTQYKSINSTIVGLLQGGPTGRAKTVSEIDNKDDVSHIKASNVIEDNFFFQLYFPLDSYKGIVLLQAYQDNPITSVFKHFLQDMLKMRGCQVRINSYLPSHYKEVFSENYVLANMTFSSNMRASDNVSENSVEEDDDEYIVKVTITPKNEHLSDIDTIKSWATKHASKVLEGKQLIDFDKARVNLKGLGEIKKAYFDFDENMTITPSIFLQDIEKDKDGRPNFIQIKDKCDEIFTYAKSDIYR